MEINRNSFVFASYLVANLFSIRYDAAYEKSCLRFLNAVTPRLAVSELSNMFHRFGAVIAESIR
jgi:hypothetical protein